MRIRWLERARREVRAQRQYIVKDQPTAAARITQHIVASVERLATFPYYGRVAPWDSSGRVRELPVAGTRFVVVYELDESIDTVIILRVVDGAQRRGSY